jgi:hypothetical protein
MSGDIPLRLTRSQHMALIDILVAYVRGDDAQTFIDCSAGTETTAGELLSLVCSASDREVTS